MCIRDSCRPLRRLDPQSAGKGPLSPILRSRTAIGYILSITYFFQEIYWQSARIRSIPVSYTHLDVYKRQIYSRLLREKGEEKARMYLAANETALEAFRSLCRNIPCGFEETSNFVYAAGNPKALEAEALALQKLGISAGFHDDTPLPFHAGAVEFPHQAKFHPLRFVKGFAGELRIFENTPVRAIEGHTAVCTNGRIRAKAIVIATHFPFLNKHGSYFMKLYQHRSYVLALSGADIPKGMFVGDTENSFS